MIGFKSGNTAKAYPHRILDWHEIINDEIEDVKLAVTYCPLTGTAIGWERVIDGEVSTFGVSGLLFNTNLIPYDRKTQSAWSQMLLESVNGPQIGNDAMTYQVVETTWATWKEMYPNTTVVSTNTGFNRNYRSFPYINTLGQDYRQDPFLLFPIDKDDKRLPGKERVLGVLVNGVSKAYRFDDFQGGTTVVEDNLNGTPLVVVGNKEKNFLVAYNRTLSEADITFSAVQGQLPVVMQDNEGNQWDVFGVALSGPREGQRLQEVVNYIGYWFAWGTFYQDLEIFGK